MAWLISKALMMDFESWRCSQEQEGESSEAICSDGEPSVQSSSESTPQAYCVSDKMTAFSRLSRFGMTFAPLTESRGEDLLMWYLADSHARTSASQAQALGWTVSGQDSGQKWRGSLAKYAPDSHSLKTAQCSLFADSTECCVTLPRSGTMRSGVVYQREKLAHSMSVTVSGLLQWPTPTVCGNYNRKGLSKTSGDGLATAVAKWPTPQASDNRDRGNLSSGAVQRRIEIGKQISLSQSVSSENGRLNPTWVEWLMGWPQGLTDLKPQETDKFLEWQQQHSISWRED